MGAASVIVSVLLCSTVLAADPRVDPERNVIRLLHIDQAWSHADPPALVFLRDPKIEWTPVPAHAYSMGMDAFRSLRLYLPRSKDALLRGYDVVLIDGMDATHLRLDFQHWLVEGVSTQGLNFLMADDSSSFATTGVHNSWYIVPIGEILPVDDEASGLTHVKVVANTFRVIPEFADHEFTNNIPWDEVVLHASNRPWPRLGATAVTRMSEEKIVNRGKKQMTYWEYPTGHGRSLAWVHKWGVSPEFWRWRYGRDVVANVIYFSARVPIPQDLVLIQRILPPACTT